MRWLKVTRARTGKYLLILNSLILKCLSALIFSASTSMSATKKQNRECIQWLRLLEHQLGVGAPNLTLVPPTSTLLIFAYP